MNLACKNFRQASGSASPRQSKPPRHKITRDCPRVTLRLSVEDHERLTSLADGMALSTYIRAKALGDALPRKTRRSKHSPTARLTRPGDLSGRLWCRGHRV